MNPSSVPMIAPLLFLSSFEEQKPPNSLARTGFVWGFLADWSKLQQCMKERSCPLPTLRVTSLNDSLQVSVNHINRKLYLLIPPGISHITPEVLLWNSKQLKSLLDETACFSLGISPQHVENLMKTRRPKVPSNQRVLGSNWKAFRERKY